MSKEFTLNIFNRENIPSTQGHVYRLNNQRAQSSKQQEL